jgi:hypothetical protein
MLFPFLLKISDDTTSTEAHQEGDCVQDPSGKAMAPWTFDIKFPRGTEFTFRSLTFTAGEDGDLRMLPPGKAAERIAPSSASSETQAESDLLDGPYIGLISGHRPNSGEEF